MPTIDFIHSGRLIILVDTNIFFTALEKQWNIHFQLETKIKELYELVVPSFILQEIMDIDKSTRKKKLTQNFAKTIAKELDEKEFLSREEQLKPVDDKLIELAKQLPVKNYVLTQDGDLLKRLLAENVVTVQLSTDKAKIYLPETPDRPY